jgi:hypothetical protein
MNASSDDRPEDYGLNAEDLGWKTHFRWPKSFFHDGVKYHDSGPTAGLDCFNLNEHIYDSEDRTKTLFINRYRDRRGRWQQDPSYFYKPGSHYTFPSCPQCGKVHNRKAKRSFTCRNCGTEWEYLNGMWQLVVILDGKRGNYFKVPAQQKAQKGDTDL